MSKTQPQILDVSVGFTYTWDASKPDAEKVVRGSVKIDGVPVTATGTYRVAIDEFIAGGGDNFIALKNGTDRETGEVDHDALVRYFSAHNPLDPRRATASPGYIRDYTRRRVSALGTSQATGPGTGFLKTSLNRRFVEFGSERWLRSKPYVTVCD